MASALNVIMLYFCDSDCHDVDTLVIEIGVEQAPFALYFFSSFERTKNLLIMGPNNIKNSSKSVISHI
jgi:hypothetical protein